MGKWLGLAVAILVVSGCGKKKTEAVDRPTEAPIVAETLPAPVAAASTAAPTPAPRAALGEVTVGRVTSDVTVPDAALVVASLKDDLASCYEAELAQAAGKVAAGRLDLVFTVEPTGSLVGKPTVDRSSVGASLGRCVADKAANVRFPGFAGRRATIRAPLTFAPKK